MSEYLHNEWFVPNNIGQTIRNLIDDQGPDFPAACREVFADALYRELRFYASYTRDEFNEVIIYLYDHLDELWQYYKGKV